MCRSNSCRLRHELKRMYTKRRHPESAGVHANRRNLNHHIYYRHQTAAPPRRLDDDGASDRVHSYPPLDGKADDPLDNGFCGVLTSIRATFHATCRGALVGAAITLGGRAVAATGYVTPPDGAQSDYDRYQPTPFKNTPALFREAKKLASDLNEADQVRLCVCVSVFAQGRSTTLITADQVPNVQQYLGCNWRKSTHICLLVSMIFFHVISLFQS